jgi:hypothetical protein
MYSITIKNNSMKKISFFIAILALISAASCKKQLTEVPKSFLSPGQFYKTDQDATQAVNAVYADLVGRSNYPNRLFQQELWQMLDENCDAIRRPGSGALNQSGTNPGYAINIWGGCYLGIYNANAIIDQVPKSGTSDIKNRSVAEAKFLRALFYYYLQGLFGDVPLITESNYANSSVTKSLSRTPVAAVRTQIIKDLTDAISVLPATYGAADQGRATKGAAQTLLIKAYLWNKDWKDAETVAQAIKSSGTYVLLPNYADVFSETNEFNQESIFEINFVSDLLPSYQHAFYLPDSRVEVEPFKSGPWYRVYVPYKTYANSFSPSDKRAASEIVTGYNGQPFQVDAANNVNVWFGPKWWRLDGQERNSGLDIYVFRYADVLLMLSEAANEQGDQTTALEAINEVRARAGLPNLSGLGQDALRTAIQQERNWELCGEGHRRLDLVRWGIYVPAIKAAAQAEEPALAQSYQTYYNLLPVPASEIQKNPALTQNSGY